MHIHEYQSSETGFPIMDGNSHVHMAGAIRSGKAVGDEPTHVHEVNAVKTGPPISVSEVGMKDGKPYMRYRQGITDVTREVHGKLPLSDIAESVLRQLGDGAFCAFTDEGPSK